MSERDKPLSQSDGQRAVREAELILVNKSSLLREQALKRFLRGTYNSNPEIASRNLRAIQFVLENTKPEQAEIFVEEARRRGKALYHRSMFEKSQPRQLSLPLRSLP